MHPPVRLIAIDVDGTLLSKVGGVVSPRNGRALVAAGQAGVTVAIATGRRTAYTAPLLKDFNLRADMPLITSNGAVLTTLGGERLERSVLAPQVARALCTLLRPYGCLVFTFDRPGRAELVLEDLRSAEGRIALWIESNRNAIEVVSPLENALEDAEDVADQPIQGMVAGSLVAMREAEAAILSSPWSAFCACVRTEYPARDLAILDLLPVGVSKGVALERLAARLGVERAEVMAIGDNWNDLTMLEWAGQAVLMGNAARELKAHATTRGWKQAPPNDQDGVAVVIESALAKIPNAAL
jgi:hydroxymethylpyrimidine pyrophosphatase-like HAD family hydrolase